MTSDSGPNCIKKVGSCDRLESVNTMHVRGRMGHNLCDASYAIAILHLMFPGRFNFKICHFCEAFLVDKLMEMSDKR